MNGRKVVHVLQPVELKVLKKIGQFSAKKKRLFNAKIGQNPSFLLVQRILDYWQFVCFQHCLMLLHYTEIVQN